MSITADRGIHIRRKKQCTTRIPAIVRGITAVRRQRREVARIPPCIEQAVISKVPVEYSGTGGNALPPMELTVLGLIKPAMAHVHAHV